MRAIEVSHIAKSFGGVCAVADVSFHVEHGEIFGLLGPNGAGSLRQPQAGGAGTTTIRMLLDIFRPDRGTISVLGGPMSETKKNRIGYLPEERGLYQDLPLERCLLYLASLKEVPERDARQRLGGLLHLPSGRGYVHRSESAVLAAVLAAAVPGRPRWRARPTPGLTIERLLTCAARQSAIGLQALSAGELLLLPYNNYARNWA